SLQNPHNNPAIAVVLNEKIFQICITLIFQNSNLYLSSALCKLENPDYSLSQVLGTCDENVY
ncbi:MAG: hypothetical protein KAQ62_16050, partial [Cyclobacteriaceae bacterium]|nr:hypothetical protein [Cyclobacteriaceae bacterium]